MGEDDEEDEDKEQGEGQRGGGLGRQGRRRQQGTRRITRRTNDGVRSVYADLRTCSMEETLASSRHSSVAASRSFSSIPDPWKHVVGFAALGMFTDRDLSCS